MNKIDEVFALGFNHNSIGLQERAQLTTQVDFYQRFAQRCDEHNIESLVFLNTCNRMEFYGVGNALKTQTILADLLPNKKFGDKMVKKSGTQAVQHLFKVASGLDSQLVGDLEILGQFKKAFRNSKDQNRLSGYLERLSNTCIQSAKEIRSNTRLTSGTTSLSYAAIQLLLKHNIHPDSKILVIGLGKFGKSIAKNIHTYFPENPLTLTNRTFAKSKVLKAEIGCEIFPFEDLLTNINQFDVIISALDSPNFQVEENHFENGRNKILIDLSVPGFFNGSLKKRKGIQLFTVEEAAHIINNSMTDRKMSIAPAENIMFKYIHEFVEWSKLYEKSDSIRRWKTTVQSVSKTCPHFKKMEFSEQNLVLKKSVRRFATFVKEESQTEGEALYAKYFKKENDRGCILHPSVSQNIKNKACSTCPRN